MIVSRPQERTCLNGWGMPLRKTPWRPSQCVHSKHCRKGGSFPEGKCRNSPCEIRSCGANASEAVAAAVLVFTSWFWRSAALDAVQWYQLALNRSGKAYFQWELQCVTSKDRPWVSTWATMYAGEQRWKQELVVQWSNDVYCKPV